MFNKGLIKKLAAVVISAVTLFSVSGLSSAYVSAADTNHFKFADIDLVVDVPKELICFTRTTTNNNSYLEKLGVDEAAVLTNNMIAILKLFQKMLIMKLLYMAIQLPTVLAALMN